MYATDDLRNEHEGIKVALNVLEHLASELDTGSTIDINDAEDMVDFLKTFADRCHHGKEEDLLFPALEVAGVANEGGPIGVMLYEHTKGREFIAAMGKALPGLHQQDRTAEMAFAVAAHGYVQLLRSHITKENNILFVMAEQRLSEEEHKRLAEGFEVIEHERIGPGVHERYHAMLDMLAAKYPTNPLLG